MNHLWVASVLREHGTDCGGEVLFASFPFFFFFNVDKLPSILDFKFYYILFMPTYDFKENLYEAHNLRDQPF